MSDKPLFENLDEQEAAYAPQELPADNPQVRQARIDEGATDESSDEDVLPETTIASGAAAGAATGGPASGLMGGPSGPGGIPAVGPAIGSEALAEEEKGEQGRST